MKLRERLTLPNVVAFACLFVLLDGPAYAERAVQKARTALFAKRAGEAGRVDGFSASTRPHPNRLLALGPDARFPRSALPPGIDGAPGAPGAPGAAGATGATGAAGAPGPAGAPGTPGGPAGPIGPQGAQGPQGSQGERGLQGLAGVKGEKGDKGDPGTPGTPGLKGDKGDKGDAGVPSLGSSGRRNHSPDLVLTSTLQELVSATITMPEAGRIAAIGDADVYKPVTVTQSPSSRAICRLQLASGTGTWTDVSEPIQEDISTPSHHRQLSTAGSVAVAAGTHTLRVACSQADNAVSGDRANLVLIGTKNSP